MGPYAQKVDIYDFCGLWLASKGKWKTMQAIYHGKTAFSAEDDSVIVYNNSFVVHL